MSLSNVPAGREGDRDVLRRAAVERPDAHLPRLYELACRDQWTVAGLDWSAIELASLPAPVRQAAAHLFAQAHHAEVTAMLCAAQMMERLDGAAARKVCATQVHDEARHAAFFENLLGRLEEPGEVRPSVAALMRSVREDETAEGMMLGMQILIEGVAHSLFTMGAKLFADLDRLGALEGPLLVAKTIVGDWLPTLLARDESRHIALGLCYLRARIPELDHRRRDALEARVHQWGTLVNETARDPDLLMDAGLPAMELSRRCIDDLNLRLGQIGLEARLEPW